MCGKHTLLFVLIVLLCPISRVYPQKFVPLPERNSFWSVKEFDESTLVYDDIVYSAEGDTSINGIEFTRVYRLNDSPSILDSTRVLHVFMRQDLESRKIYFIRHYLGETTEKLGYDLLAGIGDTLFLTAFDYGNSGDSVFIREKGYADSIQLLNGEYRKMYFYSTPDVSSNRRITFIEGIGDFVSTFPNRYLAFDYFHQTTSLCMQADGKLLWSWFSPVDSSRCGFNDLATAELQTQNHVKLYPNPARDYITFSIPEISVLFSVEVTDLYGRKALSHLKSPGERIGSVDVSMLSAGYYLLVFRSEQFTGTTPFIVIR